jgi:RNA polymerase sigma-70 factor (ECF subfamily)
LTFGGPMDNSVDLEDRVRSGDHTAFRQIYDQHHSFILRFLHGMLGDHALAEDLTQETFMRAYKSVRTLRGGTNFPAWLCKIAKNLALNSLRNNQLERKLRDNDPEILENVEGGESPGSHLLNAELGDVIDQALLQLDPDKRIVFILRVAQQRSYEEIAEITGYSLAKLRTDLHRAKAQMRSRINLYRDNE